jgi:hypothetical protein
MLLLPTIPIVTQYFGLYLCQRFGLWFMEQSTCKPLINQQHVSATATRAMHYHRSFASTRVYYTNKHQLSMPTLSTSHQPTHFFVASTTNNNSSD